MADGRFDQLGLLERCGLAVVRSLRFPRNPRRGRAPVQLHYASSDHHTRADAGSLKAAGQRLAETLIAVDEL
jgi:hypothetical protein